MLIDPGANLRNRVKDYKRRVKEIHSYLDKQPGEWGRFQSEVNQEINAVFRDLILFEKENLENEREDRVYKLKNLFLKHFRADFVQGDLIKWSLGKPYGYAGDHKIIDDIYRNTPTSMGLARVHDNYFQMSTICNAVRNRKEDFKRMILNELDLSGLNQFKIMNLASGPCRDVKELLDNSKMKEKNIEFLCVDSDEKAIKYARDLIGNDPRLSFLNQNAVRIALKKNIEEIISPDFNLIYSMGLFDYLDDRVTIKLIASLAKLLKPGGKLIIADVRDKFSNPSVYFMEWVADWNLIYRADDDFRQLFIQAGFRMSDLEFSFEQQGVIQYVIATRR